MLPLAPPTRIFLAIEPVDFRTGMDGLVGVGRRALEAKPLEGAVSVFRNRSATALTILFDDGQGFWLCRKRLSQGRFRWWPSGPATTCTLSARELAMVL